MSDKLLQAMWTAFGNACLDASRKGFDANVSDAMRAVLDVLHANGYRRCAEGQRSTQWCDRAEKAEAEVARLRKAVNAMHKFLDRDFSIVEFDILLRCESHDQAWNYLHEMRDIVRAARGES